MQPGVGRLPVGRIPLILLSSISQKFVYRLCGHPTDFKRGTIPGSVQIDARLMPLGMTTFDRMDHSRREKSPFMHTTSELNVTAHTIPEQIYEMVRRIVLQFDPDRIIMFGSHARGTADTGSDADLLVVMSPNGSRRQQATAIDLALTGIDFPADIMVISPEDLEKQQFRKDTVIYRALREGIELYARPA